MKKMTWIMVIALAIALAFTACDDGGGGGGGGEPLSGTLTITVNGSTVTTATIGDTLTANYSGDEDVTYQWKRGNTNLGTAQTQSADTEGSYTVTASATGYRSKNAAVTVIDPTPKFTSFADLGTWLLEQPANTADTPYVVKLNVSDLGAMGNTIYSGKYLSLDLSGSTLTTIGVGAFESCNDLISVIIPAGVTSIEMTAFRHCTNLASVTIPPGVTSIGSEAFFVCSKLASVTIPASVTSLGSYVFQNCDSLTSVTFEGTIASASFSTYTPFPGGLRAKFYETDPANGTPGTYIMMPELGWTKQ